jgi:UDP-GlcNAc:undecaprenyl-phosphate GlcNAc-1-phosphate transferase
MFLFVAWWWALTAIVIGLVICTAFTLAPLSRRKRIEAVAQSSPGSEEALARFDPLDAAAPDELDEADFADAVLVTDDLTAPRPEGPR